MNTDAWSPKDALENGLRAWWLLAALMILGGLAGWGAARLRAPVYQAEAQIVFTIDFTRTGAMTDIEEDQAHSVVGDILASDEVLGAAAQAEGLSLVQARLMASTERKLTTWVLRVRSADSQQAANLANAWAQAAAVVLDDSLAHALKAADLQRHLDGLTACLQQTVMTDPAFAICGQTVEQVNAQVQQTGSIIHAERIASRGLLPAMSFTPPVQAQVPTRPALLGQGIRVLAGAAIGLLIGLAWVLLRRGKGPARD